MINIITQRPEQVDQFEEWKLGDEKSNRVYGLSRGSMIHLIATNRELAWIRANITGIRMHPGNQVRWVGEDAVFIANVLPKPEELKGVWLA